MRPAGSVLSAGDPSGGGGETGSVGDQASGGAGNWPTSGDRALLSLFTLSDTATLTQFNMRTRPENDAGEHYKGLMYAADGTGGNPGTLLAVSEASDAVAAGAQLVTMAVSGSPVIDPQDVWIGYVAEGTASGSGGMTDSGGTGTDVTIMLNGGETNYSSPSDPAGNWPGSPGPYGNYGAFWWDYTY